MSDASEPGDYNDYSFRSDTADLQVERTAGGLTIGSSEYRFFERALAIVDGAGINGSCLLLPKFKKLKVGGDGIVKDWSGIPFDGQGGRAGYEPFVKKVFELLGQVYTNQAEHFQIMVTQAFMNAQWLAGLRQDALNQYQGPPNEQEKRKTHKYVLGVWLYVIFQLKATVAEDDFKHLKEDTGELKKENEELQQKIEVLEQKNEELKQENEELRKKMKN